MSSRRRAGRAAVPTAVACVLLLARAAGAQGDAAAPAQVAAAPAPERRTASLGWARLPAASSCSGGATMARAVETILRREALAPASRADLVIEGRVERVPGRRRFRAVIEIATPDGAVIGARTIESPGDDCRRLDEPVALAIALMIDPEAMTRPPEPRPVAAPPLVAVVRDVLFVPVPAFAPPAAPPPPAEPGGPPGEEGPWLGFAVAPSLAVGIVPGAGAGLRVAVEVGPPADRRDAGLAWGPSSIRLGVAGYGGEEEIVAADDAATLAVTAVLPRLELCPTTGWVGTRVAFGACAALDAGALKWSGEGFDTAFASGVRGFVAAGATARGRLVLAGPLALEGGLAAMIPFTRDRFVFGEGGGGRSLAHQPTVVAATFEAGLHLGF